MAGKGESFSKVMELAAETAANPNPVLRCNLHEINVTVFKLR